MVEDGVGVGVEVVLHAHDFLGPRVSGGQALQKAAVVRARAPGRDLNQPLPRARLEGGQQTGRPLAHVGATFAAGPAGFGGRLHVGRRGRHGRQGLNGLALQHAGSLVEVDHRKAQVVGPLVTACTSSRRGTKATFIALRHQCGWRWGCNSFF